MLDANLSGHALPRQKTINVEANLLAEWISERDRLRKQFGRTALFFLASIFLACVTTPLLFAELQIQSKKALVATRRLGAVSQDLAGLSQQRARVQPILDNVNLMVGFRGDSNAFIGNLVLVLNAAPPNGLVYSAVKADVISGQMTVHCAADTEAYSVIESFLDAAGKGPNVKSTLLSTTRHSDVLMPDGYAFEYAKVISVGK